MMSGHIQSDQNDAERRPLLTNNEGEETSENGGIKAGSSISGHSDAHKKEYVVYTERWYVLATFSLLALLYLCNWNTWGPIEQTAIVVLQWSKGQVALLANWGPFTFLPSAFLFSWLLHAQGLRVSVLLSGGFLVLGCGIRCIPVSIPMMTWTMNIGHLFIGLSGPIMMGAITTISATWFPANERTTATALSATMPYLGLAASFIIGPAVVKEIKPSTNMTTESPLTSPGGNLADEYYTDDDEIQQHLQEIRNLMYIQFGMVVVVYLAALIRFPARPASPPTASALTEREDMRAGIIALVKNASFWIPAIAYACITGVFYGWTAQLGTIFSNKVSQTTSGWIGCYSNIASLVGGAITGRCADYFTGKMKPILLILIVAAGVSLTWAILLVNDYIKYNLASLYISVILFGLLLNSTIPIFLEVTVEGSFPIGEETTTIAMTWLNNIPTMAFLILPMIPSIGNSDLNFDWLNWVMLGSVIICIPLLIFYKEHYNRLDFDAHHPVDDSSEQEETRKLNK